MKINSLIIAAGAIAALALPVAANAQPVPGYASHEDQIRGTIASVGDKYTVYVRDERGYVDTVRLHDGTIINPTGLTLASGQSVTILGRADGKVFDANEIDTPYSIDDGGDYAAIDVAPYPYESYYPAYALSYPAFVSLGFGFGGGYGYDGGGYYGHGGYGYYGHPGYGRGYYGYNAGSGRSGYAYGRRYPLGGSVGGSYRGPAGGFRAPTSSGFRGNVSSSAHVSSGGFHGGGSHR